MGSARLCWQNSTTFATTLPRMFGSGISLAAAPVDPAHEKYQAETTHMGACTPAITDNAPHTSSAYDSAQLRQHG